MGLNVKQIRTSVAKVLRSKNCAQVGARLLSQQLAQFLRAARDLFGAKRLVKLEAKKTKEKWQEMDIGDKLTFQKKGEEGEKKEERDGALGFVWPHLVRALNELLSGTGISFYTSTPPPPTSLSLVLSPSSHQDG